MAALPNEGWLVATFYIVLIALIYLNRSKFEFEGKIIALLRTNTGVAWMNSFGAKYPRTIKAIASVGVVAGFIGMILIVGYLFVGFYDLFANPRNPPVISPVLPGVSIPGSPITVPLFEGLIALFICILVHEAAHGIVASAYKLKVKSSGLVLFGPIPGAFVEPDEKELPKRSAWAQLSVFAAGPWSNVLLTIVALGLFVSLSAFVISPLTEVEGIIFEQAIAGTPAELAGLDPGTTYTHVNGQSLSTSTVLGDAISEKQAGDPLVFTSENGTNTTVVLGQYSSDESACIGISGIQAVRGDDYLNNHPVISWFLAIIENVLFWVFVLSLGLGLANLLPLGPVDGGRMTHLVLAQKLPEEQAKRIWGGISIFVLGLVLILLFVPIIRDVFFPLAPDVVSCLPL